MTGAADCGVVFDCDGVLVNTEKLGWEVWRVLAGDHGIELTLADLRAITGCTDEQSVSYFRKWLPEPELAHLRARFADAFAAAKQDRLTCYPDALETLRELQARGIPVAVASNSTSADVEAAHADAGGLAEHGPHVGGGRHLLQLRRAEVVHQRRGTDVDYRRGAGHRDRLGHGRQLQYGVDPNHPAAFHDDALPNDRPESRRLEREVIGPPPEGPEAVRPVNQGHRGEGSDQRFPPNRDRRSGYGQTLAVDDDALDGA